MMELCLRNYQANDCDGVAGLWHDAWLASGHAAANDPTLDQYRERLATEGRGWQIRLACADATIVGFVAIQVEEAWLRQLFVATSFQRQGIGTRLLDEVRRTMPSGFRLRTDIGNWQARRFYETRGLRFVGETVHPQWGHSVALYCWP